MEWGLLIPIVAIASGPIAWIATTWVRAKHGYPLETSKGQLFNRDGPVSEARATALLSNENAQLRGQVGRLEERIAVLERIATDPAERTARAIDALR